MPATVQGALCVNRVTLDFSPQSYEVVTIIIVINLLKVLNILLKVVHIYNFKHSNSTTSPLISIGNIHT